MTETERMTHFLAEYEALKKRYGVEIAARLATRELGIQLQVEPQLGAQFIEGWIDTKRPYPAAPDDPDRGSAQSDVSS